MNRMAGALGLNRPPSTGGDRTAQGQQDDTSAPGLDQDKCLKFIEDRWNDLKNAYIIYHQSIWECLLYYAGQLWIELDSARKFWIPSEPSDDFVPHPRINRFSPTVDAVASNFASIPEVEAIPNPQDDPEANMVSQIATILADHAAVTQGLKSQMGTKTDKSNEAAQLFVLCGSLFSTLRVVPKTISQPSKSMQAATGVTCPVCDKYTVATGVAPTQCPQCGSPVQSQPTSTMQPDLDEQGNPTMAESEEFEIVCEIGNPLDAFPRAGARSMDDTPFFMWAHRHPLDTIWYRWNFEATADNEWPDGYAVTYEHALNFWYTGYSSSTLQTKDSCLTLEMYVEPNKVKDFPEGFHGVRINGKLAGIRPWDYPEHPVTMAKYLELPTIFFGRSVSFDLAPVQRELCAYESLIKLHGMTSAVDPIVVDVSGQVGEITGRADKVIKWRSVSPNSKPPARLGAGHLDDGIYKQRDNLHAEFQNISMAVNAFRGEQEGAVVAASAIQQLRSQAELMFSKPAANWSGFWKETIRKMVCYYQHYYTFEQLCRIVGPDMEAEVRAFKAADLNTALEWVSSQHGLPKTRDERRQELMVMWDKGALDLSDPEVRQKIYELFGETGMQRSFNKDSTRARLENQAMKQGKPVQPMPAIEDMAVHLFFHKDQAKSLDFDKWPPQCQQLLMQHIAETTALMQNQQMQQAQASIAMEAGKYSARGKTPQSPASDAVAGMQSAARVNGAQGPAAGAASGQNGAAGAQSVQTGTQGSAVQ